MRSLLKNLGAILWGVAGVLMFLFWLIAMTKWLGFLGSFLAIIIAPGLVVFPIVFWIVEGFFPTLYFLIWGIGLVGLAMSFLCGMTNSKQNDEFSLLNKDYSKCLGELIKRGV